MIKVNKRYLINKIEQYIIEELNKSPKLSYNDVKQYLYNFSEVRFLLSKRKNTTVYLDNILKRDKTLRDRLKIYHIKYKNNEFILINPLQVQQKRLVEFDYSEELLSVQFCPYMELMKIHGQVNRISYKQTKTNERVLNVTYNDNKVISNFLIYLDIIINNCTIENDGMDYDLYVNGIKYCNFSICTTNIYLYIYNTELKEQLKLVKSIYPLSYFVYFNIFTFIYILLQKGFIQDAQYASIKVLDIMLSKLVTKFFIDINKEYTQIITYLYTTFFKNKIEDMQYADYKLIKDFYEIIISHGSFVSYIVGQYKLFTYLKNKYNREIKNIALELYDNNQQNLINNIIELDDICEISHLQKSELISNDDVILT